MSTLPRKTGKRGKLRREARTLKDKALCSLSRAVTAFNSCDDDGRTTCALLHMQHAAEMLLKAILVQKGAKVFDRAKQTSISFEKCVNLATQHAKLTEEEAGFTPNVFLLSDYGYSTYSTLIETRSEIVDKNPDWCSASSTPPRSAGTTISTATTQRPTRGLRRKIPTYLTTRWLFRSPN